MTLTRSVYGCVLWALGLVAVVFMTPPASASERTNILWISVEDMSPWLACYGDETVATPNIDRLAREGLVYERAFATTPVCAPARATLITGMYATTIGAMHMRTGNPSRAAIDRNPQAYAAIPSYEATPPPEVRCFPELLRLAGYYCTNNSKRDYQFNAPVTVWDASSGKAHWRGRAKGQPFYAVFNLTVTHESGTFSSRKPPPSAVDPEDVTVPPYYPDTERVRGDIARTYDNIAAMDRRVGRILAELADDGLLGSTHIFFFSDHGVGLPRGKRSVYASGTHVPLIVRFADGRDAGTRTDRLVSFVDFAPTVLSLAGIAPPSHVQGVAFLGEHEGERREFAFINADRMDAAHDTVRAVTDGRFRYVRNGRPELPHLYPVAYAENIPMMADLHELRASGGASPEQWQIVSTSKPPEELYDTSVDPHEVITLIESTEHAEHLARLRAALDSWIESTGDLGMILPEGHMVRTVLWPPDGTQPVTAVPTARIERRDAGTRFVTIQCATRGASIGYRTSKSSYEIYTAPFEIESGMTLEIVAHRIGFEPSEVQVSVK